jgi:hypothetical protein
MKLKQGFELQNSTKTINLYNIWSDNLRWSCFVLAWSLSFIAHRFQRYRLLSACSCIYCYNSCLKQLFHFILISRVFCLWLVFVGHCLYRLLLWKGCLMSITIDSFIFLCSSYYNWGYFLETWNEILVRDEAQCLTEKSLWCESIALLLFIFNSKSPCQVLQMNVSALIFLVTFCILRPWLSVCFHMIKLQWRLCFYNTQFTE